MAATIVASRTIPGPHALPVLGGQINLLKIFLNPFTYLRQWHDRYGDLVALAQGKPSKVLAFGPALNLQLLSNPDLFETGASTFVKLPEDTALGRLSLNNLTTMNGEKHKQQRHLMH